MTNLSSVFIRAIKGKESNSLYKAKVLADDIKKFNKLLQAAYSDEWIAVYQYSIEGDYLNKMNFAGQLSDKAYNQIVKELNIHIQEEFNHAKLIVPATPYIFDNALVILIFLPSIVAST